MDYLDWIPKLKKEVEVEYAKAPKELHSSVHQMDHLDRVWERAEKLGKKLGADMEILVAAVYLHDIGRQYGLELHGPKSAQHAADALERIGFPKAKRAAVLHAIEMHDYQTEPEKRGTLEAKILYDCDKLDVFGDRGIKRLTDKYLIEKKAKKTVPEIIESIDRRWDTLTLPETKELAQKDYERVRKHFEALL
jgi:HD superfamily phosphodiesterase